MYLNVGYSTLDNVAPPPPTRCIGLEVTPSHRTKSEPVILGKSERHDLEWVPSISFVNHLIFLDFERNVFGNRMAKCLSCIIYNIYGVLNRCEISRPELRT